MKIKKFNELYEQKPRVPGWGEDTDKTNYYTFTCDITVRADSQEQAEDKMEFIANQNEDVELGVYNLSYATEGGIGRIIGAAQTTSPEIPVVEKVYNESDSDKVKLAKLKAEIEKATKEIEKIEKREKKSKAGPNHSRK